MTMSLPMLAHKLAAAKNLESAAKERRIEIEEEIILASGFKKPSGQETYTKSGDGYDTVLILKQPISVKVDNDQWVKLRKMLPPKHPARKIMVTSYKLDAKIAKKIAEDHPTIMLSITDCITKKPGKVSVELKSLTATPE